jgi:hypothetical protein
MSAQGPSPDVGLDRKMWPDWRGQAIQNSRLRSLEANSVTHGIMNPRRRSSTWGPAASAVRQRAVNVNGVVVTLTLEAASVARAQLRQRR